MPHATNPLPKFDPGKIKVPGSIPSLQPPLADTQNTFSYELEAHTTSLTSNGSTQQTPKRNPLRQFSLLGRADEIEAKTTETKPLLGKFILQGQATMIYAEPNTGKTLIILKLCLDAIADGRIAPNDLYYVNADDSSAGLSAKLRLMQDVGAHMLAPGYNGFKTSQLVTMLSRSVEEGTARGTCVIIDTLKKCTDLMDKKGTSEFADICRQYVMAGGAIVALGHTAKNPNADGTPRYQGGTDIREDFDAVYIAQRIATKNGGRDTVVKFVQNKSRADSPEIVVYTYTSEQGTSYEAKLASVQSIDPSELDSWAPEQESVSDLAVMAVLVRLIKEGNVNGQMALAKAASKECGASQKAVIEVLKQRTGDVPFEHRWNVEKGPRGVRIYRLIDQTTPDP